MSSDSAGFRRHDPAAWTGTLAYRSRAELPYDGAIHSADTPILIDTTVYIDAQVADRLPPAIRRRLALGPLVHSAVAVSELIANIGLLDPAHAGTPGVRAALEAVVARIPPEQIIEPGSSVWFEAAAISGILARTQGFAAADRRKLLNDAPDVPERRSEGRCAGQPQSEGFRPPVPVPTRHRPLAL